MDPTGGATMAKKKAGRPKGEAEYATIKLERSLIAKLKLIAADQDTNAAALASEMLRVPVDRAYGALLRKHADREAKP